MIRLPASGTALGECLCGALFEHFWRDDCSAREWLQSGLCQDCQDKVFLVPPSEPGESRQALCFGALAAHARSGFHVLEVALLPFLFIPAFHLVAWEARHVLRIGTVLPEAPASELDPMFRILTGHRVCVTKVHSFEDPRLGDWFSDLDLLVALDGRALEHIVRSCSAFGSAHAVSLADAVPWRDLVSRPLVPFPGFVRSRWLDPFRSDPSPLPSPLRTCALMGAALELEDGSPRRALLDSVKDHLSRIAPRKGALK